MRVQDTSHNLFVEVGLLWLHLLSQPLLCSHTVILIQLKVQLPSATPVPLNERSVTLSRRLPAQWSEFWISMLCTVRFMSAWLKITHMLETPCGEVCTGPSSIALLSFSSTCPKFVVGGTCCVFVKLSSQEPREELWPPWNNLHLI